MVVASLLGAAPVAAQVGEPADAPAVLLRQSLLLTPVEAAGTGVAPEVKVRVTVGTRGRVEDVEVLSITPSTEYDEVFRRATEETIEGWRYAPARRAGEPVETTLEWTIQFVEKAGSPRAGLAMGPILDEASRRATIFALPREVQAERLRHYAGLAERHLQPATRRRADTARFVVISDAQEAGTAETIAQNLEAVFTVLDEAFRPGIELQPAPYKLVAYVFWSHASFAGLIEEVASPEWANGLYLAPGLFAFHLETGDVQTLLAILIHEAVHAYADQHLLNPGFELPPWLGEGLAEYVGNSEIQKGRLVLGKVREGHYVLDQRLGGAYRRSTHAGWSLDEAKQAVRSGKAVSPGSLLALEPQAFYGEKASMHYALSWLLVHYLRHGEPGWRDEEFPALLLYLVEGYPADAALEAIYGFSPADLEEPFRAYVRGL